MYKDGWLLLLSVNFLKERIISLVVVTFFFYIFNLFGRWNSEIWSTVTDIGPTLYRYTVMTFLKVYSKISNKIRKWMHISIILTYSMKTFYLIIKYWFLLLCRFTDIPWISVRHRRTIYKTLYTFIHGIIKKHI